MIIYLDQNKWIELARIVNGIDTSEQSQSLLREFKIASNSGYLFPLSGIHLMEFSRIKDPGRRSRLGRVMWEISGGLTIAPQSEVVCREIEVAFFEMGYDVKPRELQLIGRGIAHAFGEKIEKIKSPLLASIPDKVYEIMLTGCQELDIEPIQFLSNVHRINFCDHLNSIHVNKHKIDKSLWDNWLYALAMIDILEPLNDVIRMHNIPNSFISDLGERELAQFLNHIPSRKLEVHLHRQVLRNPEYKSKHSDLEDWAGLGMAMCCCDVVICEKHFADLVSRDEYTTKARVETDLYEVFSTIDKP